MKHKISIEYDFSDMYHIVVITAQRPEYKLVWSLNRCFSADFRKLPDLMVFDAKSPEKIPYNLYGWISNTEIDYFLVNILQKSATLAVETLLFIQSKERSEVVDRWIEQIHNMDIIFSATKIKPYEKKNTSAHRQLMERLNNIAIDLERHIDALRKKPPYPSQKKDDSAEPSMF